MFGENLLILDSKNLKFLYLWKVLLIFENNGSLMKILLCKIFFCLLDNFLEIVEIDN